MRAFFRSLLVCASVGAVSKGAFAQNATGFATNRFEPSERGSEWFSLDTLDFRGHLRPAAGIIGEWGHNPLVIYNKDGSIRNRVVSDQVVLHAGASFVFIDRIRASLSVPIYAYTTGDGGTLNGINYLAPSSAQSIGDIRLGLDARLVGEYRSPFSLAGGVSAWIPVGTTGPYSSDGSIRLAPHLIAAGEVGGVFAYSAKLGFQYRNRSESFAGAPIGSELTYGAAIGARLIDGRMLIGPELFGSSVVTDGGFLERRTSPLEGMIGAHFSATPSFRISAGAGTGLTRGYGTPSSRVLLGLEWAPGEAPKDRDKDGILDENDACVDVFGVASTDPKKNGCPKLDSDKDGILDDDDACVDVPGIASDDPKKHGCPESDRDGDGFVDSQDQCPDVPGVLNEDNPKRKGCPPPSDRDKDGIADAVDACPDIFGKANEDPQQNGCPDDPDRDKDGIPNDKDACPNDPGKPDKDPKRNGCPQAFVKDGMIKILDQVKFATGSAAIVPGKDSEGILEAIKDVLVKHTEIKHLRVEGHTDSRGNADANKKLSADRAAAVVKWLTAHGIDAGRMTSQGFGQDKPMSDNTTEAGRKQNRRVEFHIEQEENP